MKVRHLFIASEGGLLDRWAEAFPDAVVFSMASPMGQWQPAQVWLRLQQGSDGSSRLKSVSDAFPGAAIVILSDSPCDEEGEQMFALGVRAYANTHADPEVLHQISEVVAQGGLWIGQSLMQRLLTATSRMARAANVPRQDWSELLSVRELEVARAVANGASNKEIARQLDITERTVKAHVSAVLDKLEVRDRLQISLKINGLC